MPDLSRGNMALDEKVATVQDAHTRGRFNRWIKLSTLAKGKPIWLPVGENPWFEALPGQRVPFVQINRDERGQLWAGILKDVDPAPYRTACDVLGIDVGLNTLIASSKGDLLGRNVLHKLMRWDGAIATLATNRQRAGLRVRSRRYNKLVHRMRSFLKNEIHRTLRQVLLRHKPAQVSVEMLTFRSPRLSSRMNRLVQIFGRAVFKETLESYAGQYGFRITEVEPAYSSQECARCHYVDTRNRKQTKFACLHCGHAAHADVNAARNHALPAREAAGRSDGNAVGKRISRVTVLQQLVSRFATPLRLVILQRQIREDPGLFESRRRHSSPGLHRMWTNPYFRTVLAPLAPAAQPRKD